MDDITVELVELGLSTTLRGAEPRVLPLDRELKGGEPPASVLSQVFLGAPDVALMTARADEPPELADRRAGADFWSVLMTLSFEPRGVESFASAWLRVNLDAEAGGQPPIAFQMRPSLAEATVSVEKNTGVEASVSALKVSGSTKWGYGLQEAEVVAYNRGRSDPAWELAPSSGRAMNGGRDLWLVVKAAKGIKGRGRVSFGADIEFDEPGLFKRRRQQVGWRGEEAWFTWEAP